MVNLYFIPKNKDLRMLALRGFTPFYTIAGRWHAGLQLNQAISSQFYKIGDQFVFITDEDLR